ncbi:50S ribosomal protein L29 [bacterium]|jgi:large subunit ribosomal protein L29|nr:50S ribosomal protein L29 [bacterium]MBT4649522.1 50S ribosomal protein L29 [bacterium]
MKIKELRQLSVADLNKKLAELRDKTRQLRFSIANNQLSHVRNLRQNKHDIARILTVLNEKREAAELEAAQTKDKSAKGGVNK